MYNTFLVYYGPENKMVAPINVLAFHGDIIAEEQILASI